MIYMHLDQCKAADNNDKSGGCCHAGNAAGTYLHQEVLVSLRGRRREERGRETQEQ